MNVLKLSRSFGASNPIMWMQIPKRNEPAYDKTYKRPMWLVKGLGSACLSTQCVKGSLSSLFG